MNELTVKDPNKIARQRANNQWSVSEKVVVQREIHIRISSLMLVLFAIVASLILVARISTPVDIQAQHLVKGETPLLIEPREASPASQDHNAKAFPVPPAIPTYVHTTGCVNVRSQPSLDGEILTDMAKDSSAEYLGKTAIDNRGVQWYLVQTRFTGTIGWVSSRYAYLG